MSEMNSQGSVQLDIAAGVASVVFDRPAARNAMTWPMYERLNEICDQLKADPSVRVVTFRGAGGQAFVAGTDIEQFTTFSSGEDGVAYEKQIDRCIARLEALPMPTVAVIEGWTIGGGLAIATACDFRIATVGSRFGVPIARTLGNCLSVANLARLCSVFGVPRVKRMLMLAEVLTADDALACGFLFQTVEPAEIDALRQTLCERLAALAPVTQRVSKEGLRRLVNNSLPADEDLIRLSYGSADFHEGVSAFVEKRNPVWRGV
jgi:enoyl-CoA hydratase/carnithine racemase